MSAGQRAPVALRVAAILAAVAVALLWWTTARSATMETLWRFYAPEQAILNLAASLVALWLLVVAFGPGSFKRRIFAAIALAGSAGLLLVLLELPALVLKFDYGPWIGPPAQTILDQMARHINRPDAELIHVHWPNSRYDGEVAGNLAWMGIPDPPRHRVSLRYDGNGFRNDADLEQADIAVIGDSFIEAALVDNEDSITSLLGRELGCTAANLGQAAYGFQQELVVLRRYALPLRPKIVAWFVFGGNDFRDVHDYDVLRERIEAMGELRRSFPYRSFTYNAVCSLAHWTTPPRHGLGELARQRSGLFLAPDGTRERLYFGQATLPVKDAQWKVAEETLAEARRLSEEAGARFLVVFIPRKFRIYKNHIETEPGTQIHDWEIHDPAIVLGEWCRAKDIAFLDLSQYLEASVEHGVHVYFPDDVHWNEAGHRVAADVVSGRVRELGWECDGDRAGREAVSGGAPLP